MRQRPTSHEAGEATRVLMGAHRVPALFVAAEQHRAAKLFEERFDANVRRVDRLFAYLMMGQWIFAILTAIFFSPRAWMGKVHQAPSHLVVAIVLGGIITAPPVV